MTSSRITTVLERCLKKCGIICKNAEPRTLKSSILGFKSIYLASQTLRTTCWQYHERDNNTMLLHHFSCVRLCVTPETAAHQAPPSLGFSRQEHWSGLPFPSPMHESEKWNHSDYTNIILISNISNVFITYHLLGCSDGK